MMNKVRNKCNSDGQISQNNMNELTRLIEYTIDLAKKQGATQVEVASNLDSGFNVEVRKGEVETVEFSRDKGISITVYFGHKKGNASSSDTSPDALKATVEAACSIAKVSSEDKCFGLVDKKLISQEYPQLSLYHSWDIDTTRAIEYAKACEQQALDFDKRIVNSEGASVSSYHFFRAYGNSHDFLGKVQSSRHGMSCVLVGQDEGEMQRDYDYTSSRDAHDLTPINQLAENAAQKTLEKLNPRRIKTQRVPVLFSNEVSNTLASVFASSISGGNLYRKNSFLVDSLGKSLFPDFVTIYEQPHLTRAIGSMPFDGDGLVTRNNCFIENGQLVNYILSHYTACKLNMQTTANCGGVHNLTVSSTGQSFEQLIKQMDRGLIINELMGHGINLITGDYSRGVAGFWVENGAIQFAVSEVTIAGNLQDMFKGIVAIGKDIDIRKSTRCGSILIDSMMVAGQ
jgi:PmbA protein